jgi:hypothetical protein
MSCLLEIILHYKPKHKLKPLFWKYLSQKSRRIAGNAMIRNYLCSFAGIFFPFSLLHPDRRGIQVKNRVAEAKVRAVRVVRSYLLLTILLA